MRKKVQFCDANNRIVAGSGVTYDANGNTTNDGTTTYTFDAENRLTSATNSSRGLTCYIYNAEGQRVRKNYSTVGTCAAPTGGTTNDYLYDLSGHLINIIGIRNEVFAGNRHLATYTFSSTYFMHADWLGTERARSNISGASYATCTSLPFGDWLTCAGGSDPSPDHFTGKQHDYESGLDDFDARYYAETIGRFMSPDWSATPVDVPYANFSNPQSLNLYSYVKNNPLRDTDPDGHCCDIDDIVNFTVGLVNAYASDILAGTGRQNQPTLEGKIGAAAGDTIATVQGALEVVGGGAGEVGGTALILTGAGAPVGVAVDVGSAALIVHGGAVATTGAANLGAAGGDAINAAMESRAGDFKTSTRENKIKENAAANGGQNKCETCGQDVHRTQNQTGQTPPENQLQVHHDPPIKDGGGQNSTPVVLCRTCHQKVHHPKKPK